MSPDYATIPIGLQREWLATFGEETLHQWTSGNDKVATADDGLITAVAEGETVITAYHGDDQISGTVIVLPPRPIEVLGVFPEEGTTFDLSGSDCVPECGAPGGGGGLSVSLRYPGEDILSTARLILDGVDVTGSSLLTFELTGFDGIDHYVPPEPGVGISVDISVPVPHPWEGIVSYPFSMPFGPHQVEVEGTSIQGRTVRYQWRFTLME
jgi:hypothetical protein